MRSGCIIPEGAWFRCLFHVTAFDIVLDFLCHIFPLVHSF
jgi:hypothetical protein